MRKLVPLCSRPRLPAAVLASLALLALPCAPARAVDLLGLYVGGAIGQSQVAAGAPEFSVGDFKENHSAFKLMTGVRPLSLIGAEFAYLDFGHPSGTLGGLPADVKMKGTAGFGIFYLPIPVVDIYVKAGVAHLQSTVSGTVPVAGAFRVERTDTSFAAGGGAQLKFGSWALRAEYERFTVIAGNPGLLSLGLTKTFL